MSETPVTACTCSMSCPSQDQCTKLHESCNDCGKSCVPCCGSYDCCKHLSKGLAAFTFVSLIIALFMQEIIVLCLQTSDQYWFTLLLNASCLTFCSIVWSFIMGTQWKTNWGDIWTTKPTSWAAIFSGGYLFYFGGIWQVTNMMASWVISGQGFTLPYFVHLMVFMPIIVYVPILALGYGIC